MTFPLIFLATLGVVVVAWYLTRFSLGHAVQQKLLDVPTQRSSHAVPTPRGGGLGFVVVFSAAACGFGMLGLLQPLEALGLLFGVLIAAVGYWDDRVNLSIRTRLFVQITATAGAMYCFLGAERLVRIAGSTRTGLLAIAFIWLAFIWLVNLTNFMDGIDGLAGTEAVTVALSCCLITLIGSGPSVLAFLYAILAAAVCGFLLWNWFPAKIFMGDVGSCFLGFCFGSLCLLGVFRHLLSPLVPLILLGVFIIDASLTLGKRMVRGEQWSRPHRTHAFQHLSCRMGHERTTLSVAMINLLWLTPWAALAQRFPARALWFLAAAWLPLVLAAQQLRAGERNAAYDALAWTDLAHRRTRLLGSDSLRRTGGAMLLSLYRATEGSGSAVKYFAVAALNLAAVYVALLTRFDGTIPPRLLPALPLLALVWTFAQTAVLIAFETSRSRWRYTSVEEIPKVSAVAALASVIGACLVYSVSHLSGRALPRSIYILDALYSVVLLTGLHFAARLLFVQAHRLRHGDARKRVLIYGANQAGVAILSDLRACCPGVRPVGFIDERSATGVMLSGMRVLGDEAKIGEIARKHRVDQVLFPARALDQRLSALRFCMEQNVSFRLVTTVLDEQLGDDIDDLRQAQVVAIAS